MYEYEYSGNHQQYEYCTQCTVHYSVLVLLVQISELNRQNREEIKLQGLLDRDT